MWLINWKLHFLEWKTHSFVLKFSPQNAENHIFRALTFQNFWGQNAFRPSPLPTRKGDQWPLFDTVGYSIQTAGYFNFYWNPWQHGRNKGLNSYNLEQKFEEKWTFPCLVRIKIKLLKAQAVTNTLPSPSPQQKNNVEVLLDHFWPQLNNIDYPRVRSGASALPNLQDWHSDLQYHFTDCWFQSAV